MSVRVIALLLVCFGTAGLLVRTPRPISTAPSFKSIVKPRRSKESNVALAASDVRLNASQAALKKPKQAARCPRLDLSREDQVATSHAPSLETAPDRIYLRC
jgi:hypothetical protein